MNELLKQKSVELKIHSRGEYYVAIVQDENILDNIALKLSQDIGVVEIRMGGKITSKSFLELAKKIKLLCAQFDATFIVYDRLDIAFLTNADGVFLDNKSIDVESAKTILGDSVIIGTSYKTNSDYVR